MSIFALQPKILSAPNMELKANKIFTHNTVCDTVPAFSLKMQIDADKRRMDILTEILARRRIKGFNSCPVEKNKLERILNAGRLSPSAKNRQEWRFVVVQKPSIRKKLQGAAFGQEHVGQAPVIVAVCTTNIDYRMPNGEHSYPIDIGFASAFMVLQATKEGLGSCVVSTFDEQEIKEILNIPFSMKVVLLILIGYCDKQPEATARKNLKRIVSYDHW